MPQTVTVLAPVRPGHAVALRRALRPIGDDIRGRKDREADLPRIDFPRSERIHFARLAVLSEADPSDERAHLLYSANFDGDLESHLAELIAITSGMDAIWGHCEGYGGIPEFGAFVRRHAVEPHAYYIAFREETVATIRGAIRRARQEDGSSPRAPVSGVGRLIARLRRALPIPADLVRAVARCGFMNVFRGGQMIIASLNRYHRFRIWNWLSGNRMAPRQSSYSSVRVEACVAGAEDPAYEDPGFREDVIAQNQLTLLTPIQPGRADRVRAVMAAIDSYAKRLSPPGSLTGVSTIHFVKWTIVDGGRRLLMISDYDGSWESYIDEFAEMILSGLDAIWHTAEGYPPDGARDVPAFKRFLRSHQAPSEIFYSAYPDATVLNIVNALQR